VNRIRQYITEPISIAPLASFRALFGLVMCVSVLRFMARGWVHELYLKPTFFFKYYGFEWVQPLGATGMYAVFVLMAASALGIALGAFYRVSAVTFFLSWTYVELLDVSNYLNHYYFVSIAAFLLIWVPAHRSFSVDAWRKPEIAVGQVPRWVVGIFRLQLGMVYGFAGLAKVQGDWLLRAQPMRMWLPARAHLPIIGGLLQQTWVAFLFSWLGCIYDLTVPFLLLLRRVRPYAYAAVIAFHLLTWWLFPIGMFPFIMIAGTLVFFPGEWHARMQGRILALFTATHRSGQASAQRHQGFGVGAMRFWWENSAALHLPKVWKPKFGNAFLALICLHFSLQVALPFRYLLYPENLFWHEQGYRFSWRVMLMEKAGYASFHVRDPRTGRTDEVRNSDYLQPQQERMMSTQPDLILQFAHFLDAEYQRQGIPNPEVYADVYATLNGSGSRLLIDPKVDLSAEKESFWAKKFVLPFEQFSPTFSEETK
jgi:Vitamin K-dependent gamma-carboxylase